MLKKITWGGLSIDLDYDKRLDHRWPCFEAVSDTGRQAAGINLYKLNNVGINTMKIEN